MHDKLIERYHRYLPLLRMQTDECAAKLNTTIDEWDKFQFSCHIFGVICLLDDLEFQNKIVQ